MTAVTAATATSPTTASTQGHGASQPRGAVPSFCVAGTKLSDVFSDTVDLVKLYNSGNFPAMTNDRPSIDVEGTYADLQNACLQYVLFKHGLQPIASMDASALGMTKGKSSKGGKHPQANTQAATLKEMLRQVLVDERNAKKSFHSIVVNMTKLKHNKTRFREAAKDVFVQHIARLYERYRYVEHLVEKLAATSFSMGNFLGAMCIMCYETNQALIRQMRNSIQHFNMEDDSTNIVFNNIT